MSVKIFGSTGIEFSDSNQEIKIKGPTQTFSLKATTDDEFTVYNAANKLWGMSSAGLESKPNFICFDTGTNPAQDNREATGSNYLPMTFWSETKSLNNGNHYEPLTGLFNCPKTGVYFVHVSIHSNAAVRYAVYRNNGHYRGAAGYAGFDTWHNVCTTMFIDCVEGDTISLYAATGTYHHGDPSWGGWGVMFMGG